MTSKLPLSSNREQTLPRVPHGIPETVACVPSRTALQAIANLFNIERVVHVTPIDGTHYVHLFATLSPGVAGPVRVYVQILPSTSVFAPLDGSSVSALVWPRRELSLAFDVRGGQPSPQLLLQGFVVHSGAAVSVWSTTPGALFFGYVVSATA